MVFANWGGFVLGRPGFKGTFGGLLIRMRAPATFGDFLQVFVIIAGSLTMTVFGLRELGGWEAMRALIL